MNGRLAAILRAAGTELRSVRGEIIFAVALAAVLAVALDETVAVFLGIIAILGLAVAALFLSSRSRRSRSVEGGAPVAPVNSQETVDPRVPLARARLLETAAHLDLADPPGQQPQHTSEPFTPRVSVVVPCFNDERYVAEALRSVAEQTYENWECVVVDDASGDGSWEVIQDVVADDPRFETIRLEVNTGSGAARNRGLAAASGDYVAFLDADDLLLRESLTDRVLALGEHRDDPFVAGAFSAVRSEPEDVSLSDLPDRRHATQEPFIDFVVAGGECPFTLHAPLVESSRIRALGGFDESMTSGAVDWDLWYRMLRNGNVFVPSRTLGAIYRQKPGGITRSNKSSHTRAAARLVRAAYAPVDPSVMVSPTPFPMTEPLGTYEAMIVVAERAIRFSAMALAEGDPDDMRKTLEVLDEGTWPLLERHVEWRAVVGRGVARVVGLRPKDVVELGDSLAPYVHMVKTTVEEVTR